MAYFALSYHLVDDYLARRRAFRGEHLGLAIEAHAKGELLLGGAFSEQADQALLIFRALDKTVAEAFAKSDPYVLNGLVKRWEVHVWNVVIGNASDAVTQPAQS
jgi:uncharacterized protein YciI